jgi:hypothetical protein
MKKFIASPFGRVATLVTVLALCLIGAQAASLTATADSPAATSARPVAHTDAGTLTSRVAGKTGNGRLVTGSFVPLHFKRHHGKMFVRGLVQGVVHETDGTRTTFAQLRTLRVKSINGTPARNGKLATQSRATCRILNLVLAPLDLNLLGLKVHLDRVVLNIVAESGAGNLLGNLLCSVTHLLDGGLQGLLGRVTRLLNRILGNLRLG